MLDGMERNMLFGRKAQRWDTVRSFSADRREREKRNKTEREESIQ